MTSGPPPEEPTLRSSPCLLSPTSPKPIHLPTPTNIPILEMQNDVEFNQTELHMNDPAMHNTELRPGAWKDPADQGAGQASAQPSVQDGAIDGDGLSLQEKAASHSRDANVHDEEGSNEPQQNALADKSDVPMPSNGSTHPNHQALSASQSGITAQDVSLSTQQTVAKPDAFSNQANEVKLDGDASTIPGSVDVQSLLTSLQTAPGAATFGAEGSLNAAPASPSTMDHQHSQPSIASPLSASGPNAPAGLPPRPPPQEQPLIHPNYVHSQHIRDYHPHAANPAFQPHGRSNSSGNATDTPSRAYVPPVHSPSDLSLSGDTKNASFQQTPVSATAPFQSPIVSTPQSATVDSRRENYLLSGEPKKLEDAPWTPETQRKYDQFIETERNYVQQGRWEQFPNGSRLFVGTRDLNGRKTTYEEDRLNALAGNLSSEKVTKRDIFHVFHPYGDLAQISIKQAYGFVQFFSADDCARALAAEQSRQIRDKRIHLEVSKPQKNRPGVSNRRSRSPEYGRAPSQPDRFRPGSRNGHRDSRDRDSYRGYRSPSPRGYGRDRFDGRYRQRSPPSYNRYRRSPSPRREREPDDDLPLPKRAPQDIPDLQIIVVDSLDRDFISWVENAFTSRGIRVDVLILSPRLSEQGVIRRQILEGVLAVCRLTRHNQSTAKIGLQVFDRRAGVSNVKFEEYDGLEPLVACELVLRAKQTNAAPVYNSYPPAPPPKPYGYDRNQPPQSSYQYPPYQQPLQQPLPLPAAAPPGVPPNLQNIITSLDPTSLQNILSAVGQNQTPVTPQPGSAAAYGALPQQPQFPQYGQQQHDALAALRNNPALTGALQQQYGLAPSPQAQQQQAVQTSPTTGGQVNMQDILARLGNHGR